MDGQSKELYADTYDVRSDSPTWDIDTTDLIVDSSEALEEDVRKEVYALIRKSISEQISNAISFAISESLEECIEC